MPTLWRVIKEEFKKHPVSIVVLLFLIYPIWLAMFVVCSFLLAFPILVLDNRDEWVAWWVSMLKALRSLL